ncbi:hypothetical protein ERX37_00670 [Macrococcus hajekii]|uniref:Lipoprotein n=1 Tax=Macrococcus hajekii TaxID=198482 RepID=A0A4R6BLG3_9STAP|nr:hypothetical protein [Macrococcus hajekii]TDM02633.1 hypothetical protein ERX37_00670 [Macrococcus hajekii]GGB02635.1 hypothetical protein GCM10007190_08260 [Macrococcus hajekii]
MYKKLTAGLLATIVLAGCQADKDIQVTDTASQIKAAQETKQDVKSYASTYKNKTKENSKSSQTYLSLKKDKDDNQEVTVKNQEENGKFYVYENKAILQQDGQWIDASKLGGSQLLAMTTPLLYSEQFKLIDKLKDADYKSGTLTETITSYEQYLKIFGQQENDKKAIKDLQKKFPDIHNTITVNFNKNNQIEKITNDLKLKNKETAIENNAVTTFSDINNVKLEIPNEVKQAKTVGE